MVSLIDLNKALREWNHRNGWNTMLAFSTPRSRASDVLIIEDKGELVSFTIPYKRIYMMEVTDHRELVLCTTKVTYTFTEGGVKVVHH